MSDDLFNPKGQDIPQINTDKKRNINDLSYDAPRIKEGTILNIEKIFLETESFHTGNGNRKRKIQVYTDEKGFKKCQKRLNQIVNLQKKRSVVVQGIYNLYIVVMIQEEGLPLQLTIIKDGYANNSNAGVTGALMDFPEDIPGSMIHYQVGYDRQEKILVEESVKIETFIQEENEKKRREKRNNQIAWMSLIGFLSLAIIFLSYLWIVTR